ncbi:MAG: hypothetical protein WBI29_03260, partial [Candidatus Saccharimonadales bacterium]
PGEAEALLNCRIFPGETIQEVYERIRELVADDVVTVEPVYGDTLMDDHAWNPTAVADIESPQYNRLADLILGAFPGVKVAPFMMSGATDARYYNEICKNAFRFTPFLLTKEEVDTVHGVDERLSFVNAGRAVGFYQLLIQQVSSLTAEQEIEEREGLSDKAINLSEEEVSAVDRMNEPLPVKPLDPTKRKALGMPPEKADQVTTQIEVPEAVEWQESEQFIDGDEPLVVKPMKKKPDA